MISKKMLKVHNGKEIYQFTIQNEHGAELVVTNFGVTIIAIRMPDRNGKLDEVVLGYDDIETYIKHDGLYFGSIIGRYGNRIKDGRFQLNGKTFQLNRNESSNHLHGGRVGFDQKVWESEIQEDSVVFEYFSPDGEENYPGNLSTKVRYSLSNGNAVIIEYEANCDQDTIINLTNHAYFNLNGATAEVYDHLLTIDADFFTPTDNELIPTGELRCVGDTPFDFRNQRRIGESVCDYDHEAIAIGNGYDHNFVLNGEGERKVAELYDPSTGRLMEVITDQPSMQFFTGYKIPESSKGLNGKVYGPYYGICLEPDVSPNSPNEADFPNCILRKGEVYTNVCKYIFSTK